MENKQMTEKESLELISQMILNSKNNVQHNAGGPALLWGYATVITSIIIYFGWLYFQSPFVMFGWFLIPIIGGIGMRRIFKKEKSILVKTYLDRVVSYIWIVMGIVTGTISIAAFLFQLPILFFVSILMSASITLTGCVAKYKPYIYFGIAGIALSYACLIFRGVESILIFAAIFVITMIIPGYIVNASDNKPITNEKMVLNKQ